MTHGRGTCGFCGFGGGYLGEMGDDASQTLHSAVRSGSPPKYSYKQHPNAWTADTQFITWCGMCIGGLEHKYQRYDDTNLRAAYISHVVRLEQDGIRWSHWEEQSLKEGSYLPDDPAIHLDKLTIKRDMDDMENEMSRRLGFDLTKVGWRP